MNICLLTPSFLPNVGGMEYVVKALVEQYIALGHSCVVLAKTPRDMKTPPNFPYPVYYYRRSRSEIWFLGSPRRMLEKLHRQYHFDVIHAQQAYPTGYLAVEFARKHPEVTAVITSHSGDTKPNSRFRRRPIILRRMKKAMLDADAVTAVGSGTCADIDGLLGRSKALLIENGCSVPADAPPPERLETLIRPWARDGGFDLTVGRLHSKKGLNFLVDACAVLRRRKQDFPHLVIAGSGPEEENLARQVHECGLEDKIHLIGPVTPPERDFLLRNARFFLLPSLDEGMPLSVLESLAAGCPVAASALPGVTPLVRDGWNGRLFEPGSAEAVAAIYPELTDAARAEYAPRTREILDRYSWQAIARRYLELFRTLAEPKSRTRS